MENYLADDDDDDDDDNVVFSITGSNFGIPIHLFTHCLLLFKNETLITIHPIHMLISGQVF